MHVSRITLQQFRSHHERSISFDDRVTVIIGPNGSGKTNVLEALYVMGMGKSFRDSDEHLAEYDHDWWKITATVDDVSREVRYLRGDKTFIIGDATYRRLSQLTRLPIVLFEPDDLYLVHGSPAGRRRYLDLVVGGVTSGYSSTVRRYERIVAQRNRLLKSSATVDDDKLFVWDIMLAEEAEKIITARREIVELWNEHLPRYYSHISDSQTVITAAYHTRVHATSYKQSIINLLRSSRDHDRLTGTTSVGPHRDDVEFFINGKSFVTTASRGEIRSLLLALKRFELDSAERHFGTAPLLLLDDVFSELDENRQKKLTQQFYEYQIIVTTAHDYASMQHAAVTLSL